jgi:hypothetical protein
MVGEMIDGIARVRGKAETRRVAVCRVVGLAVAGLGGWRGAGPAAAGVGCTKLRRRCRHRRQCCSLECRQGRCRR